MRVEAALVLALATCHAHGAGDERGAPVVAPITQDGQPSSEPRPLAVAVEVPPARPLVILERVTDWAGGEGRCKVDDDCVVVDRFRQEELCPPGLSVSRELAEAEVVYRLRNGPYSVRPGHCPDTGLTIRPVCGGGTCAAQRSPEAEAPTSDEVIVGRALSEIEACYRAALEAAPDLALSLTIQLVVARSGYVASARPDERGPEELRRCVVRRLYGLEFPRPERTRKVTVPFIFQPPAAGVTRSR